MVKNKAADDAFASDRATGYVENKRFVLSTGGPELSEEKKFEKRRELQIDGTETKYSTLTHISVALRFQ